MDRFERVVFTINSKLEVQEDDSNGLCSWLVTVSVMACGGLLPYDIRKIIDTKTFCLACTNPRFKWIPLDFADKSILMFRIDELAPEEEEDHCELKIFAYTMPIVMEMCVSMSQDFTGKPKTVASQPLWIREFSREMRESGIYSTLDEL